MSDKKISGLSAKTTLVLADLLAIVDTEAEPQETKKATLSNLKNAISPSVDFIIVNDLQNRGGLTSQGFTNNTTAMFGAFRLPFKITVNKITIRCESVSTPSTLDIAVYSQDGQTKLFEVTTASIASASTFYTTIVDSVLLLPGIYYLVVVANVEGANLALRTYLGDSSLPTGVPAGEPVLGGTKTVEAGTLPNTFDPSSITSAESKLLVARLDN